MMKSETSSNMSKEGEDGVFNPPKHFYFAFFSLSVLALAAALSSTSISIALAVSYSSILFNEPEAIISFRR
jgi:hypothetical protein